MKSKGFLIFADDKTHLQQAYLCALSIKASNNKYPVSVVTDAYTESKHSEVFDEIKRIPWKNADFTQLQAENRWKIYHITPYERTIVLDSDILVLQNLEYFWNAVSQYQIYYPTTVFSYRQEVITSDYYRKAFTNNKLPNFYNAFHYFEKSDFAHEFFDWMETVTNNWQLFYGHYCKENYPNYPSMDITAAIVAKILDCDDLISNQEQTMPNLVHMKPKIQGWKQPTSRWQDKVGVYLNNDLELKIGNHRQNTVFHYTENTFPVQDMIRKYEKCLNR